MPWNISHHKLELAMLTFTFYKPALAATYVVCENGSAVNNYGYPGFTVGERSEPPLVDQSSNVGGSLLCPPF